MVRAGFEPMFRLLTGQPIPDPIQTARAQARAAYETAKQRGDTRAMHAALDVLQWATRAELGR